jgi:hypothetical protein
MRERRVDSNAGMRSMLERVCHSNDHATPSAMYLPLPPVEFADGGR